MRYLSVVRIIGFLLMLFSVSVVVPLVISLFYSDGGTRTFEFTGLLELLVGFSAWFFLRKKAHPLKTRDGFLVVAMVWFVLSFFAAIPFYISPLVHISFTDAFFESVSGLTTTGASIIPSIEHLPHAILFYRQELQFMGGMGIVVLAVAVLPMLGIGGMQLYRAETPGPMKDSKLTPRITETAKALWLIYIIITVACALSYWLAGMSPFEAIGESFGTVSTGGFSLHNSSFAFYQNNTIYLIAIFFMFISGVSFALHFSAFQRRSLKPYWRDVEFTYYFWLLFIVIGTSALVLATHHYYQHFYQDLINSAFNIISVVTTTGFTNSSFNLWPTFLPVMIMCAGLIGACGGSTSGGIKVMRFVLVCKQAMREMRRLIHPNGVYPIKFGSQVLPIETIEAMWGFIGVYVAAVVFCTLALMSSGLNMASAFSATVSALANVGAGIGQVASGFTDVSTFAKWLLSVAMIAGRLEIFTLLLLFTPAFWRK